MKSTRILSSSIVTLVALISARQAHGQAISLGGTGTYLQDFNSLTGVATNWTNNGTFPGWYAQTDVTLNPLPLGVFTPGGGVVSGFFDVANGTDHALGWRPTTTNYAMTMMGVVFQNTSGGILSLGQLQYTGELWRTQATANNVDGYQFFYQISNTPVTNLGPFTVNNGATYAANAAQADPGWNRLTGLDYATSNAAADAALNPAITQNVTQNLGLVLQPGEYITLRWRNPNDTAGDALMAIDDVSLSYFLTGVGANLVYNPNHTVGGAPNGVLAISPAQYWTNGGNPSGLAQLDSITFDANVTATIDVPANIALDAITVSAGNYTIGGAGAMQGRLTKSGPGTLTLTSANAFSSITLNDNGTIVALADNAISANSLTLGSGGTLDVTGNNAINGAVTGAGPLTKIGPGQLTLAGGLPNTYTGDTNLNAGTLILGKLAGTVAIPGNLNVAPGGIVRYIGNNVGNQIADTAVLTLNQASFGDLAAGDPTNPGAPETVASVVMTGGQFSTGRAAFATTGNFTMSGGGRIISHRGGTLAVGNTLTVEGIVDLHGGSTTAGQESRVSTGAGGLVLNNSTFRLNNAAEANIADNSAGSIVLLGGNVVSTGTSSFVRANPVRLVPRADIDLQGVDRTFNVTGSLRIGSTVAPVLIQNGGVVKTGPGVMTLGGNQVYTQPTTINAGKISVDGSLASSTVTVNAGGTLAGIGSVSGAVTVNHAGGIEAGIDGGGMLIVSSLTLGAAPTDTTSITLTQNVAPATLSVLNPGGLVANGTVQINLAGDTPQLGQHLLIDYEGAIGGAGGFGAFTLGTIPNRMTASLINENTQILLDVIEVDQPVWSGRESNLWSTAALPGFKNWVLNSNSATATDYLENDNVLFTNFAFSAPNPNPAPTTNEIVDISGAADVAPSSVRFTHTSGTYTITGSRAIAGTGSLTVDGTGTVVINNVNSFTGGVTINGGSIEVASIADAGVNSALGAGNAVAVLNSGALIINAPDSSTNRALDIGSVGGALILSGNLTMSGALSGSGTLAKIGPGKLTLTGASPTFVGTLHVQQGSVRYTGGSIGGANMTVVVDTGSTLENNDVVETVFNDALNIGRILSIGTGGATINVLNATGAMLFDRPDGIAGSGAATDPIRKTGPGIMRPHVDNVSLQNPWILDEGTLEVGTLAALGSGMVTMNGGLLASRNVPVQNPITVNGGTLGTRSGDVADFQGTIAVNGPMGVSLLSYTTPTNSQTIMLSGSVEGTGNITVTGLLPQTNGGNKALVLTNPINSYSGTIFVSPGQFLTSQPASTGSALGTATVSLNDAGLNIRDDGSGNDGFLSYNNSVIVTGAGVSTIDVNRAAAGTFVGNTIQLSTLSIGAQTLNVTGGNTYKAAFSGATTLTGAPTFQPATADLSFEGNITGAFGFTKAGAGRMTVNGSTTFTGPVAVQAGTLAINGTTSEDSDFTIQGGELGGIGVIGGDVNVTGGALAPGNGIGVLSVGGNVAFSPGSVFSVQLSHATVGQPIAGNDYDQLSLSLSAASTVTLNNASLTLNVGAGILENDLFFVLLNDGADAINGVFAGLSDGATFSSGGQFFQISYDADATSGVFDAGGNDIALMAVPEPGSLLLLGGGLFLLSGRRRRA